MEQVIKFQGHDFNMIEEGLYKTEDDFIMDSDDFLAGNYGELVIAAEVINEDWHPRYLSRFAHYRKIEEIVNSKKNYGIAEKPDFDAIDLANVYISSN